MNWQLVLNLKVLNLKRCRAGGGRPCGWHWHHGFGDCRCYVANLKASKHCDADVSDSGRCPIGCVQVHSVAKACLIFVPRKREAVLQNKPVTVLPALQQCCAAQGSAELCARSKGSRCHLLSTHPWCLSSGWYLPASLRWQVCTPLPGSLFSITGPQTGLEELKIHAFLRTSKH